MATPVPTISAEPAIEGLTTGQQDAYAALKSVLDKYGLSSLAQPLITYLKKGFSQ